MDDLHQDIYREPSPKPSSEPDRPLVELTPAQMRSKTWRNTIGFTVLMLVIFGLAAWLIFQQEKKSERKDLEEASAEAMLMPPARERGLPEAVLAAPAVAAGGAPEELAPGSTAPKVDGPKMARAMAELRTANEYLNAREFDKAEHHARQALAIWPNMNAAMRMIGVIYTQRGQFDQAIAALEAALKTDPFSAEALNNLATAYMHRGDMAKAEELLQTSLQIRPGYSVAYMNLGLLYLAIGQYGAAADNLQRALDDVPTEAGMRNNLAVALLRLGRYDEARQNLNVLLEGNPAIAAAYFNMAITYTHEKNYEEALNWIRRGAERCSPVALQKFLADSDFNELRGHPEFQSIQQEAFPQLPAGPKT